MQRSVDREACTDRFANSGLAPGRHDIAPGAARDRGSATVLPHGKIAYADVIYSTPSAASGAASGTATSGWTFWAADTPEGRFTLAALREEFLARRQ